MNAPAPIKTEWWWDLDFEDDDPLEPKLIGSLAPEPWLNHGMQDPSPIELDVASNYALDFLQELGLMQD